MVITAFWRDLNEAHVLHLKFYVYNVLITNSDYIKIYSYSKTNS